MALVRDPWGDLRRLTPARIALGRVGGSLPTSETLGFALAHAKARDAVYASFDTAALEAEIAALGWRSLPVASAAPDRATYLARPDLGRHLSPASREALLALAPAPCELALIVADGLSAKAIDANAAALLRAFQPFCDRHGWRVGPVALAQQGRVALGDEIGELLRARMVVMLIGERPGLSSADSLGAYLTFAPRLGRVDGERNCISNIRDAGLKPQDAAFKLAWLIGEALKLGLTGVGLKDESEVALPPS